MGSPYHAMPGYGFQGALPPHIGAGYGSNYLWPYRNNATVVDVVPRDMLYMIHDHWYRFAPINPLWHSLLGVAMVILGLISVFGNGIVIYLMVSVKSLRTPNNLLVTNLAFSDFAMMAFMMPTMAANCFAETWILGPFMCEFYGMWGKWPRDSRDVARRLALSATRLNDFIVSYRISRGMRIHYVTRVHHSRSIQRHREGCLRKPVNHQESDPADSIHLDLRRRVDTRAVLWLEQVRDARI